MTYLNERWELVSRQESRQNLPLAMLIALVGLVMFVVGLVLSSVSYAPGAALAFGGLLLFGIFGIIHSRTIR